MCTYEQTIIAHFLISVVWFDDDYDDKPAILTLLQRNLKKTKLRGLSPRVNYTDRATAACRRS
jgi:hypothetical protein